MNPDQIKLAIEQGFPQVSAKPRHNPDGWSFYVGSTRIARAVQITPQATTYFKLAISSLQGPEKILVVQSLAQLTKLVANGLSLLESRA